jgi:hypothetical protein
MARVFTVRAWVEVQVRAETPEEAEREVLAEVRALRVPFRPERWQAAVFGSRPERSGRDLATEAMAEHDRRHNKK